MTPKDEKSWDEPRVKIDDEDIVVSGFAGRFPESDDMYQFRDNLIKGIDLVTDKHGRWQFDHPELPRRMGRVNGVNKFDADFFNINFKEAHTMDPMCRMLMEHTFEAILDAGINPKQLRGTNAGVFIGASFSESEMTWVYEKPELNTNGSGLTGCARSLFASRVSHWLGVTGPSYNVDTACSSSLYAIEHAYMAIRNGLCDSAIAAGVNLCLHPNVALMFSRLGVLSPDGRSKCFDNRANGYVRGETIGVAYLQKTKDAKRIYATIVHAKTNCDGFKPQGITFPSSQVQSLLLKELYEECKVPPSSLSYVEAHGTGTSVGDPEELNAIQTVLCPGRKDPLKIGSVKSNIGHAEPASGMGQLAKILIAYETGVIPPTLHYKYPREGVDGLVDGRLKVVTEPTKWNGGLVGISSFGFGGANAHVLLKSNPKEKINGGAPKDNLSRLVVASGRTEEAVRTILADVASRPVDAELIRLLHDIHAEDISGHHYRGYTILPTDQKFFSITPYSGVKPPIWFIFSGIGSQWPGMGTYLLRFPVFASAIKKCDDVLNRLDIDIYDILTNTSKLTFENLPNSFVGITAVQIGLVDVLTSLGIVPDGIIGHSVGELGCAYADGCLTAEQMILSAHSMALALTESGKNDGPVSAVGVTNGDIKNLYPPQAGPRLLAYLKKIIPSPKRRSCKWHSTSVPKFQWNLPVANYSSPEYHTNNLLSPVLFDEMSSVIPENAVTIEIAPHGLLQSILKSSRIAPGAINLVLSQRRRENELLLQSIGRLYEAGLQPKISKLYPEIEFPVSRKTPMISPLIKWEHSQDWFVSTHKMTEKITSGERRLKLSLTDDAFEYMEGHVIDGRNLLPATGYLTLIWETVGMMIGEPYSEVPVVFEDVKFLRATTVSHDMNLDITCMVQKGTGRFEVIESGVAVVTGRVRQTLNPQEEQITFPLPSDNEPENMSSRDVYKELRLRGYQYSGLFRAIESATTSGSKGTIRWAHNWVAFMDNMLQMQILGLDTRSLFVPTGIRKLTIDTKSHSQQIRAMPYDKQEFKVYMNREHGVIRAGGIEIHGLQASAISRRRPAADPVLETYEFVAHRDRSQSSLKESIRIAIHLALENYLGIKVTTLEFLETMEKYPREELLSPYIADILADLPMMQADVNIVATASPFDEGEAPQNVVITDPKKLNAGTNALILAGRDLLVPQKRETLKHLLATVRDSAFVITLESSPPEEIASSCKERGFNIIFERLYKNSTFLLLKRVEKLPTRDIVIRVNNSEFTWVNCLKSALTAVTEEGVESSRILIVSDGTFDNGLLGLVNCLRKEPGGETVRGVLIQDPRAPDFDLSKTLYADQMSLDVVVNVLRPARIWGSYRHLAFREDVPGPVHHAWANQVVRGDLTSFRWIEGPFTEDSDDFGMVKVIYSSMNFKDVMLATGKLIADDFIKSRTEAECVLGFEYAGVDGNGRKVMGMVTCRAMTNLVKHDPYLTWTVPDAWSLEEAATIPCVYGTCCYALYFRGRMERGDKVLIHAGSGGVGQAAINLALWTGCEVFTTVGTTEKRLFIRKKFPQIPDDHIGNSRDSSFEQMIMDKTNGKGVDIVLNSLAEEKLQASVRCLAEGGRFLEIGKFDMANNSRLGISAFLKGISFYGVLLDKLFDATEDRKRGLHDLMQRALDEGAITPLNVTIFPRDQIEPAFRYMAAGKHIGKVILRIQDENNLGQPIPAFPRYHCLENRSYLILGGLGGFGLELADWLVLRGAQNLILTSRSGVKNGYQHMRIKVWESYGVNVTIVSGKDSSNSQECREILSIASKQGPVDGIYNLAVVLKDSLFENQTPETFEESFAAKAWTTKNLDELSRELCPKLRHFVVFSSVSCGRGNAGQTNYGMSNSVMERICERRASEGLPALAIQWGAVGDVGLVADMQEDDKELVIGGTLQQKITSCLHELDGFLNQISPVVASMVVAEKRTGGSGALNLVDTVLNIMGFKDLASISHHTPLAELGMDSMMAVEIRQTLEREFEIFLTAQDIRGLSFAKLLEMNSTDADHSNQSNGDDGGQRLTGLKLLIRLVGMGEQLREVCLKLPTMEENLKYEIFLIPGIEGCGSVFMNLAGGIRAPATCLQLSNTHTQYFTVQEIAEQLSSHVLKKSRSRKDFVIVGYSYGSIVAIELVRRLEAEGLTGKIILIDGSPEFMKMIKHQQVAADNDAELETYVLLSITELAAPKLTKNLAVELQKCKSWNEKLDVFFERIPSEALEIPVEQRKNICTCIYNRLRAVDDYDVSGLAPLKSPIILLKPTVETLKGLPADYALSKVTSGRVEYHEIHGDHVTILDNPNVVNIINEEPIKTT